MKNKNNNFDDLRALSISQTAVYACVSEGTVRNWLSARLLPFEELPGRGDGKYRFRLIRKQDLDKFLKKHYQSVEDNTPVDSSQTTLSPR